MKNYKVIERGGRDKHGNKIQPTNQVKKMTWESIVGKWGKCLAKSDKAIDQGDFAGFTRYDFLKGFEYLILIKEI